MDRGEEKNGRMHRGSVPCNFAQALQDAQKRVVAQIGMDCLFTGVLRISIWRKTLRVL